MEGYLGPSREGGDRPAAVADEMIVRPDEAGESGGDGSAIDLRQDRVEGRAPPVAGDEDRDVILMQARMS
ncbi:MAG TPA: hypothetical protein VMB83_04205, partial [Roseiarcus sp.]|nr:hypothetical protein [Roseiarcus sp.]